MLPERWRGHVAYMSHVLSEGLAQVEEQQTQPKLIDGRELMQELGLPQGPDVGRLLNAIEEARAAGEVATREDALALATSMMKDIEGAAPQGSQHSREGAA
jgi:hypothetical protein